MDKKYEAVKEILEDQMKKIMKKGDITPQELDSLYKASAICLDFETKEAMKNAEKQEKEKGEYSQRGGSYDGHGYANDGYSTHYPWFMKGYGYDGRRMDHSNDGSYRGSSYDKQPNWNEGTAMGEMHEQSNRGYANRGSYRSSYDGQSYEHDGGSYDGSSYRRGRDARTGRYVSRDSGSYDYSRHEEKEHMLDRLESMLDNASNEKDRRAIEQCIDRISR